MDTSSSDQHVKTHTVRPRWTWIALAVLLAGVVVLAVGDLRHSWVWAGVGLAMLVVGGAVALYGGFFYDVQGGALSSQMRDVSKGAEHEFPDAGTRRSEGEVKEDVHRRWLDEE